MKGTIRAYKGEPLNEVDKTIYFEGMRQYIQALDMAAELERDGFECFVLFEDGEDNEIFKAMPVIQEVEREKIRLRLRPYLDEIWTATNNLRNWTDPNFDPANAWKALEENLRSIWTALKEIEQILEGDNVK